jgi:hypothetical protein
MSFNLKAFIFYICVIMPFIFSTGCSIPHTLKASEIQTLQTGTPLQRVQPKKFVLTNFKDIRGKDPFFFHKNPVHEWNMDKSVADVVTMAFKNELERNGHSCITEKGQPGINFVIEGAVYKFSSIDYVGFWTSKRVVEIAVKLTIINPSNSKSVFVKSYEGESHYESGLPGGPTYIDMISEAQIEMLKEFSTDLELISFIENASGSVPKSILKDNKSSLSLK